MDCINNDLKANVKGRLATSAGHLKSIITMLENDAPCEDILQQLLAVQSNLRTSGRLLLKNHITHCVVEDIQNGDVDSLEHFSKVLDEYLL